MIIYATLNFETFIEQRNESYSSFKDLFCIHITWIIQDTTDPS